MPNEKLGTLDIDIKIDFKKVNRALGKISNRVKRVSSIMGRGIKSALGGLVNVARNVTSRVVSVFTNAFKRIVQIVKTAMIVSAAAITGLLAISVKAASQQEDAEFALQTALGLTGDATKDVLDDFKAYASALQKTTVIGDEATLALLAYFKQMGIGTKDLKKAVDMTVGLAASTGKSTETIKQLTLNVLKGETALLARYIPALKGMTDKTKIMAIINKRAADGMKVAEGRILTTSGALTQMKNAVGDVTEVIGKPFLVSIVRSSKAIQKFAEDNQQRIAAWAQTTSDAFDRLKARFLTKKNFDKMVSGFKTLIKIINEVTGAFIWMTKKVEDFFKDKDKVAILKEDFKALKTVLIGVGQEISKVGKEFIAWIKKTVTLKNIKVDMHNIRIVAVALWKTFGLLKDIAVKLGNGVQWVGDQFITLIAKTGKLSDKTGDMIFRWSHVAGVLTSVALVTAVLTGKFVAIGAVIKGVLSGAFWLIGAIVGTVGIAFGLVTTASVTMVGVLSTLAAAVGWVAVKWQIFMVQGILKSLGIFDAVNSSIDWMVTKLLQLSKILLPKWLEKLIGLDGGDFNVTGKVSQEKQKAANDRAKEIRSGVVLPTAPVARRALPTAPRVARANSSREIGITDGERQLLAQLKTMTMAIEAQPAKQAMLSNIR